MATAVHKANTATATAVTMPTVSQSTAARPLMRKASSPDCRQGTMSMMSHTVAASNAIIPAADSAVPSGEYVATAGARVML